MKISLCIVGIFFALVLVSCEDSKEIKQFDECAKEVGLPEDQFNGPVNMDDPKMKCLVACVMKKRGHFVDGKVAVDKTLEAAQGKLPGGATDSDKAAIKECAGKANEEKEECVVAAVFHKCIMEKIPRLNA